MESSPVTTQHQGIPSLAANVQEVAVDAPSAVKEDDTCVCGRRCKGRRGLRAHQRAYGLLKSLLQGKHLKSAQDPWVTNDDHGHCDLENDNRCSPAASQPFTTHNSQFSSSPPHSLSLNVKSGLKLPKSKERWAEANTYFHSIFSSQISNSIINLDTAVQSIQDTVYNYFADTCGVVTGNTNKDYASVYSDQPIKRLKRSLAALKKSADNLANTQEIRYVSSLIRDKLKNGNNDQRKNQSLQHDLKTKFWSACRAVFDTAAKHLPTFKVNICHSYFVNTLSQIDIHKSFTAPRWMTGPSPPDAVNSGTQCPTYSQVAAAVNRCRPGSSACPLDQLSIIILKHCPILRTLLHHIITECWKQRKIPECWRKGATVLIFKKGDTSDPANFRPITQQPVWYKIFLSVYSNPMHKFLVDGNYIDRKMQKGFWRGIDGVTEHTELLGHILHDAKKKQRSITVTLLDQRNAFGSIHHNLILFALRYHHVPHELLELFSSIYSDSYVTVAVEKCLTEPIKVEKGVLQGDPSSALLFNLCFNTLMLTLQQPT